MPYLMGGFPDLEASRAIGEAYADGGADLVELGVPFSDPLADGPVIHAAGTQALAAGATVAGGARARRARSRSASRSILMCYANLVLARGVERFADELRQGECQRADHSGPPARGGAARARGVRRGRDRARPAGRADDPGGPAGAHRRPGPRLRLHGVGDRHDRRARRARRRATCSRGSRPHSTCRSRSASASPRPSRPPPRRRPAPTASSWAPAWCGRRPRGRTCGRWSRPSRPRSPRPDA